MATTAKPTPSWRDVLKIHPAAELFPLMPPDELKALGEDIKKNGLTSSIATTPDNQLLDGRNRLDAMEMVGIEFKFAHGANGLFRIEVGTDGLYWPDIVKSDPYAYVISANIHRRHLTAEQKRELIAKLIKATPEKSDRQIAEAVKASPTTVGTVRTKMEATGDVSKLDTRRDTKGRKQPAKKSTSAKKPKSAPAAEITLTAAEYTEVGSPAGASKPPAQPEKATSPDRSAQGVSGVPTPPEKPTSELPKGSAEAENASKQATVAETQTQPSTTSSCDNPISAAWTSATCEERAEFLK